MAHSLPDRIHYSPNDTVLSLWESLGLPRETLSSLVPLPEGERHFPSSYKIDHLAQSTIALATLAAALVHACREESHGHGTNVPKVTIPPRSAALAFVSERLYTLSPGPLPPSAGPLTGFYLTRDDKYVRIHDSLINHRRAITRILDLPKDPARETVAEVIRSSWDADELEKTALYGDAVVVKLRSRLDSWPGWPIAESPVSVSRYAVTSANDGNPILKGNYGNYEVPRDNLKPLKGLRVLELTRVIAGPVAGRSLAALGADVLWLTSFHLATIPSIDIDVSRGKRTIQLDYRCANDKEEIDHLLRDADVFIQSYRPGCLDIYGLSMEDVASINPGIIYANLSAYAEGSAELDAQNPWSEFRGFDSMVQTCSGLNVSEAQHYAAGSNQPAFPARVLPCQVLDHASGYLLTSGILAALYQRDFVPEKFGAYRVDVSLAGVMKYLQSLGQYEGASGFQVEEPVPQTYPLGESNNGWSDDCWETQECEFGSLRALKFPGVIEGCQSGWDFMPKRLGRDEPRWLGCERLQRNPGP